MKLSKKTLLILPAVILSLTSCGKNKRYEAEKYVLNYYQAADAQECTGDFNILQLSDIHLGCMTDNDYHFKFIAKTIQKAKDALGSSPLHLIVITGDTFTFANKTTVEEVCNFFEGQKIPWAITFGNHDEQGYFAVDWLTNYLTRLSQTQDSHLLFVDYPDDDVFGSANYVIDLHDDKKAPDDYRQLVIMDSNRYNYGEGMGYDYIHLDQIDWYSRMHEYFFRKYLDVNDQLSSLAFWHIALPEYKEATVKAKSDESLYLKGNKYDGDFTYENCPRDIHEERDSTPLVNTGFFDRIEQLNYTKGIFVGHTHANNSCINFQKDNNDKTDPVALCYGVKSTNTVYYSKNGHLGGSLIRFHNGRDEVNNQYFQPDIIFHSYKDLEVK
ncbi:MAG: metallophosphoesterase [Bacilli bacterium]|nr:metallophosphoesterase [Bacilli bacterium]